MRPRVSFKTIGCRLNQAETAQMAASFTAAGYAVVGFPSASEVAVIHGCAITHKAERDSLRFVRSARRHAPRALIVLTGCPAEAPGSPAAPAPAADLVVGQSGKFALPDLLHRLHPERFPAPPAPPGVTSLPVFETRRALVKVQDGCAFGCAYCIVPRARGAPRSRPLPEIADEIRRLAGAGFREVVLTGANLGCYADGSHRLIDVVRAAESVAGIERIRLSSIEITTAEDSIVAHMAVSEKLCRFLHIPLQSGDDDVLRAMGRRYTADQYRRAVGNAVDRIPDLGLGTDIIVGFPGETEASFEATVRCVEALPFSNLHVFPFSRRAGTRAATMADTVEPRVTRARVARLLECGARQRAAFAARFIGRRVQVLVESLATAGVASGWTGEYLPARIETPGLRCGMIAGMTVDRVEGDRLHGRIVTC